MAKLSELEHESYYNSNGDEIPSITTILKLLNKPELMDWANAMGRIGKNHKDISEYSAQIGTYSHYIIERISKKKILHHKGMYEDLSDKQIKCVKNCVNAFKEWKKDREPIFVESELRIQNEKVGGTLDCICDIDFERYLIDFKTSKKIYPSYFIQLAGYNYLYRTVLKKPLNKVGVLLLDKKKAQYNFKYTDISYLEEKYEPIFLLLLDLYYDWKEVLENDWNEKLFK